MKVTLHWGSKNSKARFRVRASDLETAEKELRGREEWASFRGNLTWRWKDDGQGKILTLTLNPSYTITMPLWTGYRGQPDLCKQEWDSMWRALLRHEDGHKKIFEQAIAQLVRDLEQLQDVSANALRQLLEKAVTAIQKKHDEFDRVTDHGRSRGVELRILEPCRSKPKNR